MDIKIKTSVALRKKGDWSSLKIVFWVSTAAGRRCAQKKNENIVLMTPSGDLFSIFFAVALVEGFFPRRRRLLPPFSLQL